MTQALAKKPEGLTLTLIGVTGTAAGKRYKVQNGKLTIGRSSDNDISISEDQRCSRHHAVIKVSQTGYILKSLNENNMALLNGEPTKKALLFDGAEIQVGDTKFKVKNEEAKALQPKPQNHIHAVPNPYTQPIGAGSTPPPKIQKRKSKKQAKSPMFYILLGVIALFFIWIFFSDSKKVEDTNKITTERDIEAEIEAAKQLQKAKEQQKRDSKKRTVQYKEAQTNYIKGFRDYKKGQYQRARESFQTCLSLFPTHALCARYLTLSTKKFNEIVQYHMILGKDYKDRNQFRSCMNSLKTVMVMVKDRSSQIYKQAKANYDSCFVQLGDGF